MQDALRPLSLGEAYWLVSVALLGTALPRTLRVCDGLRRARHRSPVQFAAALVLGADLVMELNFMLRHAADLWRSELVGGVACRASAFATIATMFVRVAACALLAWAARASVTTRAVYRRQIVGRQAAVVALGVALALGYELAGAAGEYRGLYCAVRDSSVTAAAQLPVALTVLPVAAYSARTFREALRVAEPKGLPSPSTRSRSHEADRVPADVVHRESAGLAWSTAARLVAAFLGCWALIVASSLLRMGGFEVPLMADVVAAWIAKLQPLINARLFADSAERLTLLRVRAGVRAPQLDSSGAAVSLQSEMQQLRDRVATLEAREAVFEPPAVMRRAVEAPKRDGGGGGSRRRVMPLSGPSGSSGSSGTASALASASASGWSASGSGSGSGSSGSDTTSRREAWQF